MSKCQQNINKSGPQTYPGPETRSGHGRNPIAHHVFHHFTTNNSPFWAEIEAVDSGDNTLKVASRYTKSFVEVGGA